MHTVAAELSPMTSVIVPHRPSGASVSLPLLLQLYDLRVTSYRDFPSSVRFATATAIDRLAKPSFSAIEDLVRLPPAVPLFPESIAAEHDELRSSGLTASVA